RSTAEVYDPATGTFAPTAALPDQRRDCPCGARNRLPWALKHATLLNDGRVFVAGGDVTGSGSGATLADVFDPNTERWSQLDIGCDAARGTQALLHDGRVLIVCVDGTGDVRARLFDPASRTFSEAAKPSAADSKATALADGRILLTGRDPIIYEPASDLFLALPPGPRPDQGQTGIDVGSGRVLFLGDEAVGQATLTFDDRSGTFAFGPAGFASADAVVALGDGRILTVGDRLEARLLDPGHVP
ncbi:MAG: Kelch repeat-containing protein, partial [Chloroflexota bacterium]